MRRTPIRRGPAPRRKVGVKAVNRARKALLFERNFGEYAEKIRAMPCIGCGLRGNVEAAHAVARKMGGCGGDKTKLVPLCGHRWTPFPELVRIGCHHLYDVDIEAFTARTGLTKEDLVARARELWETYGEEMG